jgi:hypothetical protein
MALNKEIKRVLTFEKDGVIKAGKDHEFVIPAADEVG